MVIQEYYRYSPLDFNEEGINPKTGECFADLIGRWEHHFHEKYPVFYATHFFAGPPAMLLLKSSLEHEEHEDFGMELFDGRIDMERHFLIDEHSRRTTIYALGSFLQENAGEYMYLIRDDSIKEGRVILKYIQDSEEGDEEVPVLSPAGRIKHS